MVKCPRCGSRNVHGGINIFEIILILIGLLLFLLPVLGVGIVEKYSGHNISFQVPANWSVTKDAQLGNDTFVMLNNSSSFIRIDIVSYPLLPTLRNISGEYNHTLDYMLMGYLTKMQNDRTRWENLTGSSKVHPDGLYYVSFQSTGNSTLMFAWTKPEYGDKYIVVKGNFFGPQDKYRYMLSSHGHYGCPVDLVNLLNNFRTKYSAEERIEAEQVFYANATAKNLAKIPQPYYLNLSCPGMNAKALKYAMGADIPRPYDSKVFHCSHIASYVQWRLMSQGYDAELCISNHFRHVTDNGTDGHSWVKVNLSGTIYYIDGNPGYALHESPDTKVITLYLHSPDPNSPDINMYQYYNQPEETFKTIYDFVNHYDLDGWDWWNSTSTGNTGLKYQDQVKILENSRREDLA
jgi:hypothetical protein